MEFLVTGRLVNHEKQSTSHWIGVHSQTDSSMSNDGAIGNQTYTQKNDTACPLRILLVLQQHNTFNTCIDIALNQTPNSPILSTVPRPKIAYSTVHNTPLHAPTGISGNKSIYCTLQDAILASSFLGGKVRSLLKPVAAQAPGTTTNERF